MNLGTIVVYAGGISVTSLAVLNVINTGLSLLSGAIVIGKGVYFGGRLVYKVAIVTSGFIISQINNLWQTQNPLLGSQ